jgi:hypothetical protein
VCESAPEIVNYNQHSVPIVRLKLKSTITQVSRSSSDFTGKLTHRVVSPNASRHPRQCLRVESLAYSL